MSLIFILISIIAGAILYEDVLIPTAIVALVITLTLIVTPLPTLAESLAVLAAVTIVYLGITYLVQRVYLYFKQK